MMPDLSTYSRVDIINRLKQLDDEENLIKIGAVQARAIDINNIIEG